MKYSSMGSNPRNAVSIPALSGGVNYSDALNLVDDNQMTDCKNVWYKDGVLKTRPGIVSKYEWQMNTVSSIYPNVEIQKNMVTIDDVEYKLAVTIDGTTMGIFCLSPEKNILEGNSFIFQYLYADFTEDTLPDSYVFYNGKTTKENGKGVYMLTSLANGTVKLYELVGDEFQLLTSDEIYAPIVYINGKGDAYDMLPVSENTKYAPASFFEGYSSVSDAWADYYFTTDGVSNCFTLPVDFDNCYLQLVYNVPYKNHKDTSIVFEIKDSKDLNYAGDYFADHIYISTNVKMGWISFWQKNPDYEEGSENNPSEYKAYSFANALGLLNNNLKFRIRPINPKSSTLSGVTESISFGGGADGIYGGTRTFLSGIKKGDNRNMFAWSGLNEPTYFSENNYTHIGEKTQRITALEKQDNMLVIYKNKSLYYSVYSAGSTYTAEDVISGKVIDVSTLDAQFPIIQINDKIGCDLPNTIQLCGDRLVWACRDNNVYMLRSANQYSTVNVSRLSHMLSNKVELSVKDATATTYDGFYMLKSGNKMYLMNYDQYYFNALPSYSDTKKAGRKMQWYIWELPDVATSAAEFISDAENLALLVYITRPDGVQPFIWQFTKNKGTDEYHLQDGELVTLPVESVIQTKMFDFGAMERFKSIEQMYVGFGKVKGETAIQYLTDKGTLDKGVVEVNENGDTQSPEFIETKRFLPGIKRALRFGLRLTASGRIAISGVLIKYKYMGVTR